MREPGCPLCEAPGGRLVAAAGAWRIVHAEEAGFPAFYRVIRQDHVREFSDLAAADRQACMELVVAIEKVLRKHLNPTKVNVASLGNAVPHLHWHVIARFDWDSHFPGAVWAAAQRDADAAHIAQVAACLPALEDELRSLLPQAT